MIKYIGVIALLLMYSCASPENSEDVESIENQGEEHIDRNLSATEIVAKSYAHHGCEKINEASISFDFRDYHYEYLHTDTGLVRSRIFKDTLGRTIKDVWSRNELERYIDGVLTKITQEKADAYRNSINSVFYFAFLPKSLKDPAVKLEYMDSVTINSEKYHKIRVTFSEEGGGEDHEDVFMYWFDMDNYSMDYLAYSYQTNGGGMRFRSVVDRQKINGIIFQDYANYAPPKGSKLNELDQLFNKGKLEQVSTIEQKNIKVQ